MPSKPTITDGITIWARGHIVANSHPINLSIGAVQLGGVTVAGCQAAANAVQGVINFNIAAFNADIYWDLAEAKALDGSGKSATAVIGAQGTLSGTPTDYAQCKVAICNTGNGRAGIGRLYVLGQVQSEYSSTDHSQWVAAVGTSAISLYNALIASLNALTGVKAAVASYSQRTMFPMVSGTAYVKNLKINHVTRRDD